MLSHKSSSGAFSCYRIPQSPQPLSVSVQIAALETSEAKSLRLPRVRLLGMIPGGDQAFRKSAAGGVERDSTPHCRFFVRLEIVAVRCDVARGWCIDGKRVRSLREYPAFLRIRYPTAIVNIRPREYDERAPNPANNEA